MDYVVSKRHEQLWGPKNDKDSRRSFFGMTLKKFARFDNCSQCEYPREDVDIDLKGSNSIHRLIYWKKEGEKILFYCGTCASDTGMRQNYGVTYTLKEIKGDKLIFEAELTDT